MYLHINLLYREMGDLLDICIHPPNHAVGAESVATYQADHDCLCYNCYVT